MSKHTNKAIALGLAACFSVSTAHAVIDTSYEQGDLIMGFQGSSTDVVLEVNLGATYMYRDATSNFLVGNIGANLSNVANGFGGVTWFENTDIFFGAAGANNFVNTGPGTTPTNGDFNSTIYYTRARTAAGVAGSAASVGANFGTAGDPISLAATSMIQMGTTFGNESVAGIATLTDIANQNSWDQYNPSGGLAFGNINGGVQDQLGTDWDFTAGTWADIPDVVAVLDLWRTNRYTAPAGFPADAPRTPSYHGSFVLTESGDIFFVAAVPEPTSAGLIGLAAVSVAALRRRRRNA